MVGRDITIGQYLAVETPLHRVDPRLKVVAVVVGVVMVFIYSGWALLAFTCLLLAFLLAVRLPLLPVLKSLRTVWVIVLVTFLLQIFLTPGEVVWHWGFLDVTDTGLYNGVVFSSRVVLLVVLLAALTMTTPPLRLADGLESLLRPLKYLKVPVARVTTVVSIALMFIPNILEQSRKLIRAQMARGADFESANVLRRVKDIVPVLVPLFVKVFHDADELALAMDARCYAGGEGRTRLYPMKISALEAVLALAFIAAAIALSLL
jgi:energy-coupling factor transport system permease protein